MLNIFNNVFSIDPNKPKAISGEDIKRGGLDDCNNGFSANIKGCLYLLFMFNSCGL